VSPLAPLSLWSTHPVPTTKPVPVTTSENILVVALVSEYEFMERLAIENPLFSVVVVEVVVVAFSMKW
jgi:hypothetical protein